MKLTEKTLAVKPIFDGKIFSVHVDDIELENGKKSKREIVEHHGGVCIAALTKDYKLSFVRQFRYPYQTQLLELPAGKLEKGEEPMAAAIRELKEECGYEAANVVSLGVVYPTVAYCSEVIHLFLATDLTETGQKLDDGEFLEIETYTLDEAVELVVNGEIPDSKTQILVLKLYKMKQDGKI